MGMLRNHYPVRPPRITEGIRYTLIGSTAMLCSAPTPALANTAESGENFDFTDCLPINNSYRKAPHRDFDADSHWHCAWRAAPFAVLSALHRENFNGVARDPLIEGDSVSKLRRSKLCCIATLVLHWGSRPEHNAIELLQSKHRRSILSQS